MNALVKQVSNQWQARSAREQGLLGFLGLGLMAAALWYGVMSPLNAWHEDSRVRYVAAVERVRTVEAGIAQHRANSDGDAARSGTGQPVRTLAGERAAAHGVTIARLLPGADGKLNVWIEQAEANAMMNWLADLDRQYGIAASRITIERDSGTLVSAQLVLERAR